MELKIAEAKSAADDNDFEDSPEDEELDALMEKLTVPQRKQVIAAVKKMINEMGG